MEFLLYLYFLSSFFLFVCLCFCYLSAAIYWSIMSTPGIFITIYMLILCKVYGSMNWIDGFSFHIFYYWMELWRFLHPSDFFSQICVLVSRRFIKGNLHIQLNPHVLSFSWRTNTAVHAGNLTIGVPKLQLNLEDTLLVPKHCHLIFDVLWHCISKAFIQAFIVSMGIKATKEGEKKQKECTWIWPHGGKLENRLNPYTCDTKA